MISCYLGLKSRYRIEYAAAHVFRHVQAVRVFNINILDNQTNFFQKSKSTIILYCRDDRNLENPSTPLLSTRKVTFVITENAIFFQKNCDQRQSI